MALMVGLAYQPLMVSPERRQEELVLQAEEQAGELMRQERSTLQVVMVGFASNSTS
jgi:hypothetical protein